MSTAAPSSHDECVWSREEINAWLESLPHATQEKMKELGRKWIAEGRDILLGFNIVRYIIEKGYLDVNGAVAQVNSPQNSFMGLAPTGASRAPGLFGVVQNFLLGRQEARAINNVANMHRHQRKIVDQQDYLIDLRRKELEAQGICVGNKPIYL